MNSGNYWKPFLHSLFLYFLPIKTIYNSIYLFFFIFSIFKKSHLHKLVLTWKIMKLTYICCNLKIRGNFLWRLPGELIFPFCFQVESSCFESISLLLNCFTYHFPKTFGYCKTQISGHKLRWFNNFSAAKFQNQYESSSLIVYKIKCENRISSVKGQHCLYFHGQNQNMLISNLLYIDLKLRNKKKEKVNSFSW